MTSFMPAGWQMARRPGGGGAGWENHRMSAANVELARRGFAAVQAGDLEAVEALLAPDVTWHGGDPSGSSACHNRAEAIAYMRAARSRGPMAQLVDVVDAGERVVLILRRPDGSLAANLTTIQGGHVVEMRHYPDPSEALAAAGVAPREP
jgi:ketosteroid isomerase-like protein